MSLRRRSLRDVLQTLALTVDADVAARALDEHDESPWFVRVMIGFGAWIASLCFLAFLAIARLLDSKGSAVAVGAVLVTTTAILRLRASGAFASQLAMAGSLAGQGLVIFGTAELLRASTATAAAFALAFEIVLVVLHVDRVHRFLSTTFAVIALAVWLRALELPAAWDVAVAVIAACVFVAWWREPALAGGRFGDVHEPVAVGLSSALLGMALVVPVERVGRDASSGETTFSLGAVLVAVSGAALLLGTLAIVRGNKQDRAGIGAAAAIVVASAITWRVPGIGLAAMVAALAFHRRRPAVVALAAAFLAVFLGVYYYELRMTLLAKSGVLVASGAVVLAARLLVPRERAS
jgi:hypothetical protein